MDEILNELEEGHIFNVELSDDNKSLVFIESNEYFYSVELNKSQAIKLIQELTDLVNQMKE